ncbi:hypothetical protein Sjap_002512 [Stephania japonica]|uniref:Uncharacterized protein n=1 Tax=Stephania japonica TaxID=461633 RepID=A0AAP0PSP7_9MAGN
MPARMRIDSTVRSEHADIDERRLRRRAEGVREPQEFVLARTLPVAPWPFAGHDATCGVLTKDQRVNGVDGGGMRIGGIKTSREGSRGDEIITVATSPCVIEAHERVPTYHWREGEDPTRRSSARRKRKRGGFYHPSSPLLPPWWLIRGRWPSNRLSEEEEAVPPWRGSSCFPPPLGQLVSLTSLTRNFKKRKKRKLR